jgi:hypothetical protein
MTPRKKRVVKVKEKLDDSFLRRSKRVSQKLEGFKVANSARKFKEAKGTKKPKESKSAQKAKGATSAKKPMESAANVEEPVPLAMIPPPNKEIAPHLPREILEGVGHGFLHI